ncbi:hypothetical protein GGX14DRAFT_534340 [Mycena pura]|uniref:Reverse transcriptase n=1 Tax=Mycena pura TaxID=153505 RepID=A0AAD6YC07_9AGAR|nr:hypothetical protein GGX14DRAFT_534340 [Mycena pura]
MTKKLVKWRKGWVGVHHGNILKCLAAELKARKTSTTFVVAPQGSTAQTMYREATRTAKTATSGNRFRAVTLDIPAGTALVGIPLQGNRQNTFYRGIREVKTQKLKDRPSTINKLAIVKECIAILQGRIVTDEDIWCSLRNKDFQPRVIQFLWKSMHNAHRIGSYWKNIPDCEDRATCQKCGVTEDLEHILIRCGLMDFRGGSGKQKHGTRRLYRILISKSAYTIRKLRNERVISRSAKRHRPCLQPALAIDTWSKTLDDEDNLPTNWLREPKVLVGRKDLNQDQLHSCGVG